MPDETRLPPAKLPQAPTEAEGSAPVPAPAVIEPGDDGTNRAPDDETVPDETVPDAGAQGPEPLGADPAAQENERVAVDEVWVDEISAEDILEEDPPEEDEPEEDEPEEGPEPAGDFPTAPLRLAVSTRSAMPTPGASTATAQEAVTGEATGLDEDAFAEEAAPEEVLEDGFEDDPLPGDLPTAAAPTSLLPDDRAEPAQHPLDESATSEDEQAHHRHAAPSEADLPAPRAVSGAATAAPARPVGHYASTTSDATASVVPPPAEPLARVLSPRMRLLYAMRPRATRAQALALALCFVLGLAGFLAVRQNQSLGLASMRQSDLVSLLDNVTEKSNRLEDETRRLQDTADRLKSGSDKSAAALQAAQQRLELLGILAGTSPAVGSGIQLIITDPARKVTAATILDTVEELRDAGAEAIQIGDVRVVASTAFVDGDNGVRVDGVEVKRPYVFLVIGDPQTLSAALGIPGGVQEVVKQLGGNAKVDLKPSVTVSALRSVSTPQYAHPATSAAP